MPDHRGSRFALEVLFLVALAVGLTLAELRPLVIGGVMLLGWLIVAALEWAAWRDEPHYGSGLPPRYYVPPVNLPPAQPLEQVPAGYPEAQRDEAPTWIASAALRAEMLGEWPSRAPSSEAPEATADRAAGRGRLPARRSAEPPEPSPSRSRRRACAGPSSRRRPDPASAYRRAAPPSTRARALARRRALQPRPARRATAETAVRPRRASPTCPRRGAGTAEPASAASGRAVAALTDDAAIRAMRPRLAVARARAGGARAARRGRRARGHRADAQPRHRRRSRRARTVALAGSSGPAAFGRRTACGGVLRADTEGVAHPTLPCGARIFITYNGTTVLTQVVDRGPYVAGRAVRPHRRARAHGSGCAACRRSTGHTRAARLIRPRTVRTSARRRSCAAYPCRTNTM